MDTPKKTISAVVVCYKDEGNILELYRRLSATLQKLTNNYEIIFVNDSSPDNSELVLKSLAERDKQVTILNQSRNFGAQAAFTAGMLQATGDAVVLLDGDLQDPPELIAQFVEKWQEGFDVVSGIRRKRERSLGRINEVFYHWFYVVLNKLSYLQIPLDAGEFSLMDRKVVDWINALPERDRLIRGLRAWVGFKQAGIPYTRAERFWGTSTNGFFKNLGWARKSICSFSYAPLEWISHLASIAFLCSLLGIIIYILLFFYNPSSPPRGITTVFVLVLFLGSIQLLSLSVIAEYVRRIFEETKGRPRYITREIINDHRKKS